MNAATAKPRTPEAEPPSTTGARGADLERRRALGQFFTSPEVAAFMWDLLEVINGRRFPASTRIIDPACGEGVFLRTAHARGGLSAKALFGADIDTTLVAGWRRDALLNQANLKPANGLLDDPQAGIAEGTFDIAIGNPPFSGNGLQELLRLLEAESAGARHQEQDFFEASCLKEEASPARPPLSRPQRGELDRLVRALSQYSCWRLEAGSESEAAEEPGGETTELFGADALFDRRRLTAGDCEHAAQLIARWPPNRPLDTSLPNIRDTIRRLASTAIEVMFTERFVRLTKPGGLIAIIVPESIVASDRLGRFRIWLLGRMDLLASVGLPQKVFSDVGAHARTTILFARRLDHDRPDGWFTPAALDQLPEDDAPVFLTAPRLDSPNWSLANYLDSVLASARRQRERFWPDSGDHQQTR